MIVYGLDELDMSPQDFLTLYERKLTPTERRYYDAWINWKRFKIQPWRFLNSKTITRDQVLMLMQLDTMYFERTQIKKKKDEAAGFRPIQQQQQQQNNSSQRPNNVKSVL